MTSVIFTADNQNFEGGLAEKAGGGDFDNPSFSDELFKQGNNQNEESAQRSSTVSGGPQYNVANQG